MAEAVIFDIDGTLLDSVDLHAKAWHEAFQHFGYNVPFEDLRRQIGKGGDQLIPNYLSAKDRESKGKEIEEYRSSLFKQKYLPQVRAFPGVRELFEKIRSNGQQVGLASSAKGDELETYEKIAHIEDLVEIETSSADADRSKPHPDIFDAAFDRLQNVQKQNTVVVGDSSHDVEAAKRAGMQIVGLACGAFTQPELKEAGCIAVYADPMDLLQHYDSSPLAPSH